MYTVNQGIKIAFKIIFIKTKVIWSASMFKLGKLVPELVLTWIVFGKSID